MHGTVHGSVHSMVHWGGVLLPGFGGGGGRSGGGGPEHWGMPGVVVMSLIGYCYVF